MCERECACVSVYCVCVCVRVCVVCCERCVCVWREERESVCERDERCV